MGKTPWTPRPAVHIPSAPGAATEHRRRDVIPLIIRSPPTRIEFPAESSPDVSGADVDLRIVSRCVLAAVWPTGEGHQEAPFRLSDLVNGPGHGPKLTANGAATDRRREMTKRNPFPPLASQREIDREPALPTPGDWLGGVALAATSSPERSSWGRFSDVLLQR